MNVIDLQLDLIEVGDRLRSLNSEYVAEIAASFAERKQMTPIEVREAGTDGRHTLVFGAHRLAAARLLGWKTIRSFVFKGTKAEARLREIDENLVRRDLSCLDRASFIAERQAIWNVENPELVGRKAGANRRWHANDTMSFASDTAEKLGVSERTISRWIDLHQAVRGLPAAVQQRLAVSPLADRRNDLLELAAIHASEDGASRLDRIMEMLFPADGEDAAVSVKAAVKIIDADDDGPGLSRDERDFQSFTNVWGRATDLTKDRIRDFLAEVPKKRAGRGPK